MTSFNKPDFAKMLDQSNQGNLMRFNKLTTAVSDLGVYTQTEIKKLQQQIDFHEKRIDQLAEENIQLNNSRIELLEQKFQFLETKKKPKKSWLSRWIR